MGISIPSHLKNCSANFPTESAGCQYSRLAHGHAPATCNR